MEYDYYCGISRDIAKRQSGHNQGPPGTQGNRKMRAALGGRHSAEVVIARRLASFGKTGITECPQPVLNAIETTITCVARFTSSPNSIQVKVVDHVPFVAPTKLPPLQAIEHGHDQLLAEVWRELFDYNDEQKQDVARGRYMMFG